MKLDVVNKTLNRLKEKQIRLHCEQPFGYKILSKILQYQINKFEMIQLQNESKKED